MSSQEKATESTHIDHNMMQELMEVMGSDFNLLLETFLNDSKKRLQALSLAVQNQHTEEIRQQAHSFKGSAGNVGAAQLSQLCKMLEDMGRAGEISQALEVFEQIQAELSAVEQQMLKYYQK